MDLVLKRLMAYVIDILIVSICMTPILNWSVINPYIDEYTENYTEYTELLEQAIVYNDIYKQANRKKCALLPWWGMKKIIEKDDINEK